MTSPDDEGEFYREIARRAKRVRERAAESLRLSRPFRKARGAKESQPEAAPKPRRRPQNG